MAIAIQNHEAALQREIVGLEHAIGGGRAGVGRKL
jgi:hypothetical protein